MHRTLKQRWQALGRGQPGRRFQDRYKAARKSRRDKRWAQRGRRIFLLLLALVSIVIAVVLMFIPGPAIPFYFLAGALLAAESLPLARLMDWIELRVRALVKWSRRHWRQTPVWARVLLVVGTVCLSATSTYVSYRLIVR